MVYQEQYGREIWWNVHEPSIQKHDKWSVYKHRKRVAYKNGRSHCTRECENSTGISGSGKCLNISSQMQSLLCTYFIMPQAEIKQIIGLYNQSSYKFIVRHSPKMVTHDILFYWFPTFAPLNNGPKSTRLRKIYIWTRKSSILEVNISTRCINNLGHLLLYTISNYIVWFSIFTNNLFSNTSPHTMVSFFGPSTLTKHNVNRGRVKVGRQQLKNFKHKGKHEIVCYLKYSFIFTSYQIQGWWTIILSPVKFQPYGRNFR